MATAKPSVTLSGSTPVVVRNASPYGAGQGIDGIKGQIDTAYDRVGLVTQGDTDNASSVDVETVRYTWDVANRQTRQTNTDISHTDRTFDAVGQVLRETTYNAGTGVADLVVKVAGGEHGLSAAAQVGFIERHEEGMTKLRLSTAAVLPVGAPGRQ